MWTNLYGGTTGRCGIRLGWVAMLRRTNVKT